MPNSEKIELLISPDALKQFEQLKSSTDANTASFEKLIAKAVELNKAVGNASTFKEINKATQEMTDNEKALAKQVDELAKANAKLQALYTDEAKKLTEVKTQQQARNQAIKEEIQLNQAAEGSIKQKQILLKQLTREYDNLSAAEREAGQGQGLLKSIQGLDKELKSLEGASGRFQRNVGNYQGSAKIIVDALERAREKFNTLSKAADTTPAALSRARSEFEALRNVTDNKQFLNFSGRMGDATQEVRTFTRTLVNLETQGLGTSEVATELRTRLAQLTDTIADTRSEVKALASDTRSFDLFASSVSFAADVFQTAAGAAVAFGASEEDAAEATKTLLAIQNISNGVKGIANELTTKGTAANKLYSFAQSQVAVAMDSTAVAGARLRGALITLGIGAIIIGIGLLVANFSKLKNALSGLSKQQQLSKEISDKAIEGYVKEKVAVEQLAAEAQRETTSKRRKLEIIKELNEKSPVYFGHIKTEKDLQNEATEAVKKYVQAITIKARAQAAVEILAEKEKAVVLRQIELERQLEAAKTQTFDSEERKQRHIKGLQDLITRGADTTLQALQRQADPVRKVLASLQEQLGKLGGDPNKQVEKVKTNKKFFDDLLKAEAELYKRLADSNDAYLSIRLSSRNRAFEIENKILSEQRKVEIDNADGNTSAIEQINREFAIKKILAEQKLGEDIINIRQSFIVRQREQEAQDRALFEDNPDAELNVFKKNLEKRLSFLSQGRDIELKALENKRAQGIVSEEQYQRERLQIENSYAALIIKAEIEYTEQVIALAKVRGEDVAKAEADLAALKLKYTQSANAQIISDNQLVHDKEKELLEQKKQLYKELGAQVLEVFNAIITGGYDRQIAAIQTEIEKLEEQKQKDIEVANATITNRDQRELEISKIEARSQAQRNALEKRQQTIEIQKAKFQKASALLSIAVDTAQKTFAIKAQAAVLAANPVTAPLAGVALAQIPFVLASSLLAAGLIAAQPLPKFAEGTDDAPGGLSWVGDGGKRELVITPQGKVMQTPAVPTVMNVPKHSIVLPDARAALESGLAVNRHGRLVQQENNEIREVGKKIDTLTKVLRNKPVLNMNADQGGLTAMWNYGANTIKYIEDQTRF